MKKNDDNNLTKQNEPDVNNLTSASKSGKAPTDEDELKQEFFERYDEDKRPVCAVLGLVAAVLCWIALFAMPEAELETLYIQLYVMLAASFGAGLLCWFGRKRAYGMAVIGMIVAGALMLFLIVGLIGTKLTL